MTRGKGSVDNKIDSSIRPRRTNAAESVVLMTPRNTYAIGSQPCETMVCKFPPPRVKTSVSTIAINPCWNCARSIICSEFAAPTGTLILGRPSGSCLGENLCGIAPSKRHFLREMAGEAYFPEDFGAWLRNVLI
jgi:hypothetical protein